MNFHLKVHQKCKKFNFWLSKFTNEIQGGPYLLGHFSTLKVLKSGPKDTGHPVDLT